MVAPLFDIEHSPPIIIKVFDDDTFGSDFMGGAVLDITHGIKEGFVKFNSTESPEPTWVDLYFSNKLKFIYFFNLD